MFSRSLSAATVPATCTKPRVRRRRRGWAVTCGDAPAVPRRRRANMRVDVKACASFLAGVGPPLRCGAPPPHTVGRETFEDAWRPEGLGRPPGLVISGRELFRDPEAGGPGAGVGCQFLFGWPHGMPSDDAEGGPVAAGADWL